MIDGNAMRQLHEQIAASTAQARGPVMASGKVASTNPLAVVLDGAQEPTPINGTAASVKVGDMVFVTIDSGTASITGNATSPATDDSRADEAHAVAVEALEAAKNGDNSYFWHDSSGAHVSTQPYSTKGSNVLIDNDSLDVRQDNEIVTSLGMEGVDLMGGKSRFKAHADGWPMGDDEAWTELTADGMNVGVMADPGNAIFVGTKGGNGRVQSSLFMAGNMASLNASDGLQASDGNLSIGIDGNWGKVSVRAVTGMGDGSFEVEAQSAKLNGQQMVTGVLNGTTLDLYLN